jgi:site-specific DNA recombinase
MSPIHAATYARVSSDRQAEAGTIESQLADLRARVAADGHDLPVEHQFIDDGASGMILVRLALPARRAALPPGHRGDQSCPAGAHAGAQRLSSVG